MSYATEARERRAFRSAQRAFEDREPPEDDEPEEADPDDDPRIEAFQHQRDRS